MEPYVLEGYNPAAGAEVTTVVTNIVPRGCLFYILSIMTRDVSSATSTLQEKGIVDGTRQLPLDSSTVAGTANISHTIREPCILKEGQAIYGKFTTASAGDKLEVIAHGYLIRLCPILPMEHVDDRHMMQREPKR
jgi:hypothetical protein